MWHHLGARFWLRVLTLSGLVVFIWQNQHQRPASTVVADSVSNYAAAAASDISAKTGLTFDNELSRDRYLEKLTLTPAGRDWKSLHEEWFGLARQFFDRLYAEPAMYNRYMKLWLTKREGAQQLRQDARREFFPDLTDRELFDRIDWLREKEEWGEMQAKIQKGLDHVDQQYALGLRDLMGENLESLKKLEVIFLEDNFQTEGPALGYFL